MALRKPLVIVSGQTQQLQSGDTLDAPQSGGDGAVLTNGESGAIVIGNIVYVSAAATVKKAKADAVGTKSGFGVVRDVSIGAGFTGFIQTSGILAATTGQWDAVFGTTGGLVAGQVYWLSPGTAGYGTAVAPTTIGQYVVPIGIGLSTTELEITIVHGHDVLL